MSEVKCWACHMYFEFDANDDRPFIWHEHPDGTIVANENPNLKRKPRKWYPKKVKPKPFWQDLWEFKPKEETE